MAKETVRRLMTAAGLWIPRKQRAAKILSEADLNAAVMAVCQPEEKQRWRA